MLEIWTTKTKASAARCSILQDFLDSVKAKAGVQIECVYLSPIYECLRFEELFFWCLTISGPDCPWSELITVLMNSPFGDARLPLMI
jgi:hypothetical protein